MCLQKTLLRGMQIIPVISPWASSDPANPLDNATVRNARYVPVPANTTPMVRMMILKSSQMLQFSMCLMSSDI